MLFYQVGFKYQCLNLIIHNNKLKIGDHLDELTRLWIMISARVKVRPHTVPQILCLADIDDLPSLILVDIDTGVGGEGLKFFGDRHNFILTCHQHFAPQRHEEHKEKYVLS